MERLPAGLGVRPLAQLLGETAVVGHGALAVGQAFRVHAHLHLCVHGLPVHLAAGEQIGEGAALGRGLRM